LCDVDLWRASAAEFLATFIFLFIVCFTLMMPQQFNGKQKNLFALRKKKQNKITSLSLKHESANYV